MPDVRSVYEKTIFVDTLRRSHGWTREKSEQFFDQKATRFEIQEPVDFALEEAQRLSSLFSNLKVVPLLYNVDNDRMYLLKKWLEEYEFESGSALEDANLLIERKPERASLSIE